MKKFLFFLMVMMFIGSGVSYGFDSGSTGALGALNPTANVEIELPANGVLNYTTVNIPAGVTVTFKRNAANTPVYMLATGDVTVAGTINISGATGVALAPGKGGPGGFEGGIGGTPNLQGGKGKGPGGGNPGTVSTLGNCYSGGGGGGGFGSDGKSGGTCNTYSTGGTGGTSYSNVRVIPMIGGSGGAGGTGAFGATAIASGTGGGGGSGAILIASSGTIAVTGSITANGGKSSTATAYASSGGGGSGGTIKLIANKIEGNGTIAAIGAAATGPYGGAGGDGRIRFEANEFTRTSTTTPPYTFGYPSTVFVANVPTLKITSIAGVDVPANPSGAYGSPDITLPGSTTNPVSVSVSAANIPAGTTVTISSSPEYGPATSTTATLSGTTASSSASASINLSTEYQCIITATATFTITTAMYYDGEEISKVRVASKVGKESEVVYITKSGKEITYEKLFAGLK